MKFGTIIFQIMGFQEYVLNIQNKIKLRQNPIWLPFVQAQTINVYDFRHKKNRFVISVSTIGFSGMSDIVVQSQNFLSIAMWAKSKMAAIFSRSNSKFIDIIFDRIDADL